MKTYGFSAYIRRKDGVKGFVVANNEEEAKAMIDAGDIYELYDSFEDDKKEGYDLIRLWEM